MNNALVTMLSITEKYGEKNPYALCNRLNIYIRKIDMPVTINGFYQKIFGEKLIFLKVGLSKEQELFTLCHELGHSLMHESTNTFFMQAAGKNAMISLENEADNFATLLIMENHSFSHLTYSSAITVENIAAEIGVSESLAKQALDTIIAQYKIA